MEVPGLGSISGRVILRYALYASHIRSKARDFALSEVHTNLGVQKRSSLSGLHCSCRLNFFTFLGSILHRSATTDVDAVIRFPMHLEFVQNLAEEVLLGRDVPLLRHMVKRLTRGEQMNLLRQLTVKLEERAEDEKTLTLVTCTQEGRMAQHRKDSVETCEEDPEEEDTAGIQEVIPDTQVGDSIEGQGSGDEISVNKDCPLGIEFPFDGELFGKPREPRVRLTRAEKSGHNQQWTGQLRSSKETEENNRRRIKSSRP